MKAQDFREHCMSIARSNHSTSCATCTVFSEFPLPVRERVREWVINHIQKNILSLEGED